MLLNKTSGFTIYVVGWYPFFLWHCFYFIIIIIIISSSSSSSSSSISIIIIIRKWVVGTNCLVISYDNIKKFLESEFEILEFFYVDRLE